MRESARYNFKVCPAKIDGLAAPIIFEDFLEHLTFYCDLFHKEANPVVVSLSNHDDGFSDKHIVRSTASTGSGQTDGVVLQAIVFRYML